MIDEQFPELEQERDKLIRFVEAAFGFKLNIWQKKLIVEIEVVRRSLHEANKQCCDHCNKKLHESCEELTIHNGHVSGCPKALAVYTERYNTWTDLFKNRSIL